MNIITISRKIGLVLMAGIIAISLVAPVSALASEDGYDYYGGDYSYDTTDYYGGDYDYGTTDYYGGDYDYGTTDYYGGDYDYDTTDYYGGDYDYDTTDYYGGDYETAYETGYTSGGSGYGGSSGGGFSMPSFGGSSSGGGYSYGGSSYFPSFPSYTPSKPSNTTVNTNVEYCKNNSCNTYTDNSVVVNESFNNQKKQKEEYRDDCYGYQSGYQNQGYGYNDYGYQNQGYNYNDCYVAPVMPIAYNTTPYITLSQTPYTGLDLGPMGEVLYWTFLVLWCLGAAYMIVVKRVQNKLVGFLNGFLFGTTAKTTVAHATHAPAHTAHTVASAPMVEEGIDSFIQSQIKRS